MEKRYLLLGLGKTGLSLATYLVESGDVVVGFDDHLVKKRSSTSFDLLENKGARFTDKIEDIDFSKIDTLLLSPGVPPSHPIWQEAKKRKIPIEGEVDFALSRMKNPVLGITGTNGKTTTTLLVAHILKKAGISSLACGNVGVPISSLLDKIDQNVTLVLELSSYQLETLRQKRIDIALLLNITEDHRDRYKTFSDYAKAKCHIGRCLKERGKLFLPKDLFARYEKWLRGIQCDFFDEEKRILELVSILPEDRQGIPLQNILGAFALTQEMGISKTDFVAHFSSFEKPKHRIEWVQSIGGVDFYNDSKATNVDAVEEAIRTLGDNLILILGGDEKFLDYRSLVKVLEKKVVHIFLIGKAGVRLQKVLKKFSPTYVKTLDLAVQNAYDVAVDGMKILLSPGSSSFDQFTNYEHRGEMFKKYVADIAKKKGCKR